MVVHVHLVKPVVMGNCSLELLCCRCTCGVASLMMFAITSMLGVSWGLLMLCGHDISTLIIVFKVLHQRIGHT